MGSLGRLLCFVGRAVDGQRYDVGLPGYSSVDPLSLSEDLIDCCQIMVWGTTNGKAERCALSSQSTANKDFLFHRIF